MARVRVVSDKRSAFLSEMEEGMATLIAQVAFAIEGKAKIALSGVKSGRRYKRGRRYHQASAPGEAPATDTGTLVNSIQASKVRPLLWRVTAGAMYGWILEIKRNRPFLRPAASASLPRFRKDAEALARKVAARYGTGSPLVGRK
jgi:hypothetical protein